MGMSTEQSRRSNGSLGESLNVCTLNECRDDYLHRSLVPTATYGILGRELATDESRLVEQKDVVNESLKEIISLRRDAQDLLKTVQRPTTPGCNALGRCLIGNLQGEPTIR